MPRSKVEEYNQMRLRPCDGCSLRRIKCDKRSLEMGCLNCETHGVPCTNNRIRKRSGPKRIHRKTRERILEMNKTAKIETEYLSEVPIQTNGNTEQSKLSLEDLLPYLQIYQTWYYCVWPVVSIAHLVSKLMTKVDPMAFHIKPVIDGETYVELTEENRSEYILACSLAAATSTQVSFLSSNKNVTNLPASNKPSVEYANEAKRVRELFGYRENPTPDTLLASFFLYVHYTNQEQGAKQAIMHLRDAISVCQILRLDSIGTYQEKYPAETHKLRKIYYTLVVSERYVCFEKGIPIVLKATIPIPSLNDEEYPELLEGFTELIKVFSTPGEDFFDQITNKIHTYDGANQKKWILKIQEKLTGIQMSDQINDTQKLNIVLTQAWLQSLVWLIAKESNLLGSTEQTCLTVSFPLQIAQAYLTRVENIPIFAFESNGPGASHKLLELANCLAYSLLKQPSQSGLDVLQYLFQSISNKMHNKLPMAMYNRIGGFISSQRATIPLPITHGEESSPAREGSPAREDSPAREAKPPISQIHSPFTQMSMAICDALSQDNFLDFSQAKVEFVSLTDTDLEDSIA